MTDFTRSAFASLAQIRGSSERSEPHKRSMFVPSEYSGKTLQPRIYDFDFEDDSSLADFTDSVPLRRQANSISLVKESPGPLKTADGQRDGRTPTRFHQRCES
jgi:hypothetical protein